MSEVIAEFTGDKEDGSYAPYIIVKLLSNGNYALAVRDANGQWSSISMSEHSYHSFLDQQVHGWATQHDRQS